MAIIQLKGINYIEESVEDDSIPAHNYDDVIDISKSEDPDQWFARVQTEWPDLPPEIKQKVIDSTGDYIGKLSNQATSSVPSTAEPTPASNDSVPLESAIPQSDELTPAANEVVDPGNTLDEAKTDLSGNEVYDFAEGRKHVASLDNDALLYTRKDLMNVISIQEKTHREGGSTPKLGYYWDEYWTVVDEIARRIKKGDKINLSPFNLEGEVVDDKLSELGN